LVDVDAHRQRCFAARLAADLLQPPVRLRVDARDEEARDRGHRRGIAARLHEPLQPADVRLCDLAVPPEREDQRHVDRAAARDALLDRAEPLLRRGDLDEEVRPVDPVVEAERLLDRRLLVEGEVRVDLHRHVPVLAPVPVVDAPQRVAGVLDIAHGQVVEDLLRIVLPLEQLLQLIVVGGAAGDRLLEDRRVRGDADDGVLLDQACERPVAEPVPRDLVDPDALSERGELVQS
jgi:hypothetical protein